MQDGNDPSDEPQRADDEKRQNGEPRTHGPGQLERCAEENTGNEMSRHPCEYRQDTDRVEAPGRHHGYAGDDRHDSSQRAQKAGEEHALGAAPRQVRLPSIEKCEMSLHRPQRSKSLAMAAAEPVADAVACTSMSVSTPTSAFNASTVLDTTSGRSACHLAAGGAAGLGMRCIIISIIVCIMSMRPSII